MAITRYTPQAVEITIKAPAVGMLTLNDVSYPGWQATVNNAPAPLYRANGTFRAVPVPAGHSLVHMQYRSTYLQPGFFIAGILWGILLLVAVWHRRARASAMYTT